MTNTYIERKQQRERAAKKGIRKYEIKGWLTLNYNSLEENTIKEVTQILYDGIYGKNIAGSSIEKVADKIDYMQLLKYMDDNNIMVRW